MIGATDSGARAGDGIPAVEAQAEYWRRWNKAEREARINQLADREARTIIAWIEELGSQQLEILEIGCGSGWMCHRLTTFGSVVGIDLSEQMMEEARARVPQARFVAGDILDPALQLGTFDVIVTMEVLAHVPDQEKFFRRCADLLRPGGLLLLTTQNRTVYSRMAEVAAPSPDQIRTWLNFRQLRSLVSRHLAVLTLDSMEPRGYRGFLRIVNSPKLNAFLHRVFSERRVARCKEKLMLGCILLLKARKKVDRPGELLRADSQ